MITYWERADLLALLIVMFLCDFVIFPFDVSSQVWYLIVLIPDFRPLYFHQKANEITEYNQEIPQSHTADQPTAPLGRATELLQSQDKQKKIK